MSQPPPFADRSFLFLQGPHGPFYQQLAAQLETAGATVWRVGFNTGDRVFWRKSCSYLPFREALKKWPEYLEQVIADKAVTDIVLYGDTRPIHAKAVMIAKQRNVKIHVFEEGYMRPYWVTYEQGGSNGHSALIDMPLSLMHAAYDDNKLDPPVPPSHWGDMRQHIFYGALYHWFVLFWNQNYRNFTPHRALPVSQEFQLYFKRLLLMPVQALERRFATWRIRSGRFPYHLALLQLEHDSSFQMHGAFDTQTDFLRHVMESFAQGAPRHHHLVFKAHPLENGRAPIRSDIKRFEQEFDLKGRVHFVPGGKLARLLDEALTSVTVNSTAGQQALWRRIPLRCFGTAVYDKQGLVSRQPLARFFADPELPDIQSCRIFRDFLLSTSQLPGSFYASRGRRQLLRRVVDMMLDGRDPYALKSPQTAADRQQLSIVR